jgi:cbb3-type cytochrome oxidase subunit 3
MELVRPIWTTLKTMVNVALLLTLVLLSIGVVVWTFQHWRPVLGAAFLVGMAAYAYSDEGRRLLRDMHKW